MIEQRPMADAEEDEELQILLESYIHTSKELEQRENQVLRQLEQMQWAVASLQVWNQNRNSPSSPEEISWPAPPVVMDIEEETRMIREETKRIQREVERKKRENKRMEIEINESHESKKMADTGKRSTTGETRGIKKKTNGLEFFNEKLRKLRDLNRKLRRESEQQLEEGRKKERRLLDKIRRLEREALINREVVSSMKRYPNTKKK